MSERERFELSYDAARRWCAENREHPVIGRAVQKIQSYAPESLAKVVVAAWRAALEANAPRSEAGAEAQSRWISPQELAQKFHETYERLAPNFGYETRRESAKLWSDVPQQNKDLMVAVCEEIKLWLAGAEPPEAGEEKK